MGKPWVARNEQSDQLTSLDQIDFLPPCPEMESLKIGQSPSSNVSYNLARLTSVSIAKSGFQLSGGMILQIPYLLA